MEMTGLERLLHLLQKTFYVDFFLITCILIALIVGIRYFRKEKVYYFFIFYIIYTLLDFLIGYYLIVTFGSSLRVFVREQETRNVIFGFFEYLVFYNFFKLIFTDSRLKIIMKWFLLIYFAALLFFLLQAYYFNVSSSLTVIYADVIISPELIFLAFLCLLYYYKLLREIGEENLREKPSFWIVTGLFFYCSWIVPFFLISDKMRTSQKELYFALFTVHYISFGLFFLSISRAFLCKRPLTK